MRPDPVGIDGQQRSSDCIPGTDPVSADRVGMPETTPSELVLRSEIDAVRPWMTERLARRLNSRGELPYFVIGARIWLDLADVDAWRDRQRVAS